MSSLFGKSEVAGDFSVFFASSPLFPSYLDSLSSRSRKVHKSPPFRSSKGVGNHVVWKKLLIVKSRLEGGSEDGSSTDAEEDVLAQRVGAGGGSSGGLASAGDAGAVGGRGVTAGLGHGGGSEDGDDGGSTHFDGCLGVCLVFWGLKVKVVGVVLTNVVEA